MPWILILLDPTGYGERVVRGFRTAATPDWRITVLPPDPANLALVTAWSTGRQRGGRPDGVVFSLDRPGQAEAVRRLARCAVNLSYYRYPGGRMVQVLPDNRAIGRLAAGHLADQGCRILAFAGGRPTVYGMQRHRGFRDAAGRQRIPLHRPAPEDPALVDPWLAELPDQCGILAATDVIAAGLLLRCRRLGLSVPGQRLIIGVDDDPLLTRHADPTLSSIPLPVESIGRTAATVLARLLRRDPTASAPVLIPPTEIQPRGSTGAAADDPIDRAVALLRQGEGLALDVAGLASRCGVARRTFDRRFRTRTGMTPRQAIERARLATVARQPDQPTDRTVARAGFRSLRHWRTAQRRAAG